jgi:predicted TIM-barrel enzyme
MLPRLTVSRLEGSAMSPTTPAYVLEQTESLVGFFRVSSMERLPTEITMTENMPRFKQIRAGLG